MAARVEILTGTTTSSDFTEELILEGACAMVKDALNSPIRQVPHPSRHMVRIRFSSSLRPEEDALDIAAYDDVSSGSHV